MNIQLHVLEYWTTCTCEPNQCVVHVLEYWTTCTREPNHCVVHVHEYWTTCTREPNHCVVHVHEYWTTYIHTFVIQLYVNFIPFEIYEVIQYMVNYISFICIFIDVFIFYYRWKYHLKVVIMCTSMLKLVICSYGNLLLKRKTLDSVS